MMLSIKVEKYKNVNILFSNVRCMLVIWFYPHYYYCMSTQVTNTIHTRLWRTRVPVVLPVWYPGTDTRYPSCTLY